MCAPSGIHQPRRVNITGATLPCKSGRRTGALNYAIIPCFQTPSQDMARHSLTSVEDTLKYAGDFCVWHTVSLRSLAPLRLKCKLARVPICSLEVCRQIQSAMHTISHTGTCILLHLVENREILKSVLTAWWSSTIQGDACVPPGIRRTAAAAAAPSASATTSPGIRRSLCK